MLKFLILLILAYVCGCTGNELSGLSKDVLEDCYSIYAKKPLRKREPLTLTVEPDNIKYYLFSNNNTKNFTIINSSNASLVNKNAPTIILIHGWTQNVSTAWYQLVTEAFFELNPLYNIIQVDYSPYSRINYVAASLAAADVGNIIGEFVAALIQNYSIPIDNILPVALSLGGQILGFVGRKVQEILRKKLPRIVALDPSGLLFQHRPQSEKLNKHDAHIVEVLHTNGGGFGYLGSCGTIDFFPNGGSIQPGCLTKLITDITHLNDAVFCHHRRSTALFASAVRNRNHFKARKCFNWFTYSVTPHICPHKFVNLGDIKTKKTGNYYLKTTSTVPYYDD